MGLGIQIDAKTSIDKMVGWVLLVKQEPIETKSSGGIALPDETVTRHMAAQIRGTVVSIADNAWHDEATPRCAVGDRILFRQYAGEIVSSEGPDKYRVINDKDVYAILSKVE